MVDRRLHVDPRLVDQAREILEVRVGEIVCEVTPLGERTHADCIAIGRYDRNRFTDMLGRHAVHDDAVARFEPMDRHVG
jgi:hypothetical protein